MSNLSAYFKYRSFYRAVFCFVLVIFFNPSPLATAQDNALAQDLLARMAQSMRELDYRGRFTYEVADSAIETYEITHRVIAGEEQERLERLNGSEKEVVRENSEVNCLATGDKILRGRLEGMHPSDQLFNNYTLYLRGEQRVAGRSAYLLQLVPHDSYRNGQSITVDKETFLPLQKQWFSPDNKLMERVQFVDIELSPALEEQSGNAVDESSVFTMDPIRCNQADEELVRASWAVNWLPKGFFLTKVGRTDEGESMLSYTDGVASFSIFVRERPVSILVEGKSNRGATIAYVGNRIWQQNPFRITVVGEIPSITAQKVIASLEPLN